MNNGVHFSLSKTDFPITSLCIAVS